MLVTHTNGSSRVNEAGYGQGFYDWAIATGDSVSVGVYYATYGIHDEFRSIATDSSGNIYAGMYWDNSSIRDQPLQARLVKYNTAGVEQWARAVVSPGTNAYVYKVLIDSGGNPYMLGRVKDGSYDGQTHFGSWDIFITKYDSHGTKQWSKQFGSSASDIFTSAAISTTDEIYITGYTRGNFDGGGLAGKYDSFILRVDSNGNQLGIVQDGDSCGGNASTGKGIGYASVIAVDSSGNYYQAGLTEGDVDGLSHSRKSSPGYCTNWASHPTDLFIRKYNSSHVRQWTKLFDHLQNSSTESQGAGVVDFNQVNIVLSNDGTQLFVGTKWAGTFNGQTSACQGWRDKQCLLLFSLDTSDGSFNWTKWPDQAEMQSLHVDASDNIYVLGRSYNGNKWPDEYPKHLYFGQNLIYKYNSSGVEQWKRQYGRDNMEVQKPDGMENL